MKIIPKRIKVKNTIWKCYSLVELIILLILLFSILWLLIEHKIFISIILLSLSIILFMPTTDGVFYTIIFEMIKYLFSNKKFIEGGSKKIKINHLVKIKKINEDGVIEYYNGGYSKVIKIGQKNFLLEDIEDQEADIECLNKAFRQLDMNVNIDIVKIERPINFDIYINDLEQRIIKNKESYKDENIETEKEKILKNRQRFISEWNKDEKQFISEYYLVVYGGNKNDVINNIDNISYEIRKCGVTVDFLNKKETAIFLKYNFSRNFDEREVELMNCDEELVKWIRPQNIVFFSNKYIIDNIEASIMMINDYPLRVKNAWANEFFNIPNSKVVMHISSLDKLKAIKIIDKCILEMKTRELLNDSASQYNEAQIHLNTLQELLNKLQAEDEALLDVSIAITSYNYTNDVNYRKRIKRKINSDNFKTSLLFCNQVDGFISTSINNNFLLKKYERGINSNSLAAFFPFVRNYAMDDGGVVLGRNSYNNYPFIFDIWKRGEMYQNSNAMIIGKSGSGKTYFLKNLLINEWSNDTRIIVCDPDAEYLNITRRLIGNIIDVGNAKEGILNPFHIYKILTEDGLMASSFVNFNTHLKTLESFFKIVLDGVSNDVLELINLITIETYNYKNINEYSDFSKLKATDYPIFSDLMFILNKRIENCDDDYIISNLKVTKLHLEKFVTGRYSDIWNSPSTLEVDANIINFNFQSLFSNKNKIVANAQMLLIFRFIEQEIINSKELNKNGKGLKTMVIIDEAHMFIDSKYPIALDFFYQMNKRIRKYNGAFIPITQNITDWNSNEEIIHKTSTIIKNSQYMFMFKLSSADMQDVLEIYKSGNSFNKEERKIIISSSTGEAFFVGSSELRTSVKIVANDYIKMIIDDEENNEENI